MIDLNTMSVHDQARYQRAKSIPDLYDISTMLGVDEAIERCGDAIKGLTQIQDPPAEVKEEENRIRDVWKDLWELKQNLLMKKMNFQ